MIINLVIKAIFLIIAGIFSILPNVAFSDIPTVGPFITENLLYGVRLLNGALETFPYGVIVWFIFTHVIIPFELLLLIGKFFLGSRNPTHA